MADPDDPRDDAARAPGAVDERHQAVHQADLALAAACLASDADALRVLDRMIRAEAVRVVGELRQPGWIADEVAQELGQRLLVTPPGGAPRLTTYAGQAPLGRWLGVAAMRTALNMIRGARPETPLGDDHDVADAMLPPELAVVRDRYRTEVEQAIRAAFDALDSARDRNLLRMYYLERIGLEQLGQMFGVHGSTVSRWLTALRASVLDDVRARLSERLGLAGNYADVDSLIRAVQSELDLTLSRLLRRA
ncbi:MAG TPA: sigma-70 family RNA polymerase sigma factor [Kofleriaceae bacterium]|nr:sigma-70 family RNA polymerase sigma factor [Kofleriaceae bacterium]